MTYTSDCVEKANSIYRQNFPDNNFYFFDKKYKAVEDLYKVRDDLTIYRYEEVDKNNLTKSEFEAQKKDKNMNTT